MFHLSIKKITNHRFFWPILTFILTIPAFFFLLKPGYYNMHDDMQMIRQLEMEKCLLDGQIPCRWTPDLGYGYGYPLFNFYPPMPYVVGQIYRIVGFSFVNSVKAAAITQIILAAAFMFILGSSVFGPIGGFISSLFYTYVPYHALNIYVRGAMNEAWAAVFFPLVFYFSRRLVLEKKKRFIVGLAASFAGILLSHNPMALTFTPILFLWVLFWIFSQFFNKAKKPTFWKFVKSQIPTIFRLIFSGIFAASLTAFFIFPVLFETKYVQIKTMFEGYYHFSVHFATVYQLFISNFWGDGASVWGPNDDMSFMVGYLHWIIPLIIFGFIIFSVIKSRKKLSQIDHRYWMLLLTILMGLFTVFMAHNKSTFIWLMFPTIQKIQFPWRFLNHSAFLFSFSAGGIILLIDKFFASKKSFVVFGLAAILIILNLGYYTPLHSGPITDSQKFSGKAWVNQVTSGIYDYLPKTAKNAAQGPAKDFVDEISPSETFSVIADGQKGSDWMIFNLNLNQSATVTLAQLAFPDFLVTDNGQKIDYQIEPKFGRITLNLSAGDHQIFVKFINTPVRNISNSISAVAWLIFVAYLLNPLWKKLISKR